MSGTKGLNRSMVFLSAIYLKAIEDAKKLNIQEFLVEHTKEDQGDKDSGRQASLLFQGRITLTLPLPLYPMGKRCFRRKVMDPLKLMFVFFFGLSVNQFSFVFQELNFFTIVFGYHNQFNILQLINATKRMKKFLKLRCSRLLHSLFSNEKENLFQSLSAFYS